MWKFNPQYVYLNWIPRHCKLALNELKYFVLVDISSVDKEHITVREG